MHYVMVKSNNSKSAQQKYNGEVHEIIFRKNRFQFVNNSNQNKISILTQFEKGYKTSILKSCRQKIDVNLGGAALKPPVWLLRIFVHTIFYLMFYDYFVGLEKLYLHRKSGALAVDSGCDQLRSTVSRRRGKLVGDTCNFWKNCLDMSRKIKSHSG